MLDEYDADCGSLAFDDPSYLYLLTLLNRMDVLTMGVDEALIEARTHHRMCLAGASSPAVHKRPSAVALAAALKLVTKRDERWDLLRRWGQAKYWTKRYRRRIADQIEALARPADNFGDLLDSLADGSAR
jgi:hypothetical protein